MNQIPLERYAGSVSAAGVYGLPSIGSVFTRRNLVLFALVGIALALLLSGNHGGFVGIAGAGIVTEKSRAHRESWLKATTDARGVLDAYETRRATDPTLGATLPAEDETRYSAFMKTALDSRTAADREEKLADEEHRLAQPLAEPTKPDPTSRSAGLAEDGNDEGMSRDRKARRSAEYNRAFKRFLRGADLRGAETRALQMDSDVSGGYTVASEQFVAELIKNVDNLVFIRQRATGHTVENAASLGFPTLAADPADFDWTSELGTGSEDSTMAFGKREFRPHPLAKRLKVSKKLLRASAIDPEGLVRDRLAYKVGVTLEKAYLTGSGNLQPLGVFVASTDGVDTARDVTASATTSWTADDMQNVKFGLKPSYRGAPTAAWMFNRDGVLRIAKLKDGNGQYLLQPGLSADIPDRILGIPFMESEYSPNTYTTGLYVGILADWSWYWTVDALDMQVQRLVELYAETNQDGFIARYEGDGMPVLAEAFSRLKLA